MSVDGSEWSLSDTEEQDIPQYTERIHKLKDELASIPFDKLLQLQQEVGAKEFKDIRANKTNAMTKDIAGDMVKLAKRTDKNMPAEMSSKRQVSRRRGVIDVKKKQIRDPRFDAASGEFNKDLFARSYGFIKDLETKEVAELKVKIQKSQDDDERAGLEMLHQKITSKAMAKDMEDKRSEIKRLWKKSEQAKVKQGKNPFFLKQTEIKKMELIDKYKGLKDKDIDKYLQKRRKKNASKEHRKMPYKRAQT